MKQLTRSVVWCFLVTLLICATVNATAFATRGWSATLRLTHDMGFRGAESIDPISPTRFVQANQMIYDRLVHMGKDGNIEPALAVDWHSEDGGRRWIFCLREGVSFHNGKPFTAADVVYTFRRMFHPGNQSAVAAVLNIIDEPVVISRSRVLFYLNKPHTEFPVLLTDYRVRMLPKQAKLTAPVTGVGTGPFKLKRLDPEGVTLLLANHQYWNGQPAVERVELYGIADFNSRLQALFSGQLDWMEAVTAKQKLLFEQHEKLWTQQFRSGEWRAIVFHNDMPPFDDYRVRKAVRIAVDRHRIMQLVSGKGGGEISCDSPVWPGDKYRVHLNCHRDVEQAKALLAQAGYPDGISFELYTSDLEPEFIPMAEAYQQQAAEAGIKVTIRRAPADTYWQTLWKKVPAMLTRWSQRPADQVLNEVFRTGALWNDSGFSEPGFDVLLNSARAEPSERVRQQHYRELQQHLYDRSGTFIPYHIAQMRVLSRRVQPFDAVEYFSVPWHKIAVID